MPSFNPATNRRLTVLRRMGRQMPLQVRFFILSEGDGFSQEVSWFQPSWQTSWVEGLYAPLGREAWFVNTSTAGVRAMRALHLIVFRIGVPDDYEPTSDDRIELISKDNESMGLYQINAVLPRISTTGQIYAWELQVERQT